MITNRTKVYDKYAKLDRPEKSKWHKVANPTIGRMLKKYKARTVLDLTCGTGGQVFWLAERGYKMTGSDLSPGSIKFARQKARQKRVKIKFYVGDMRTQRLGKFDAVITMFNAVGHLSKAGFEKAMRNVGANLKVGGIYIFDIINANRDDTDVDNTSEIDGLMVHKIQLCRMDHNTGVMTMEEVFCRWRDHRDLEAGKVIKWTMQTYDAKWLRDMLSRNGFRVLGQYALDGSKFSAKNTRDILTVAQKK